MSIQRITLQAIHFTPGAGLEQFVMEKVSQVILDNVPGMRADVILFEGTPGNPRNHFCEIEVTAGEERYYIKKNTISYERSVTEAVYVLRKALARKGSGFLKR